MQTIGGREPLHGELGRFYDAIENPRRTRGELPILRDAELRAYLADVRERTLEVLDEVEIGDDAEDPLLRAASSTRCCSPTSSSTTRRCSSCCRWSTTTSRRPRADRRRSPVPEAGARDDRGRGRRPTRSAPPPPASPTTTSAPATRSSSTPSRSIAPRSPTPPTRASSRRPAPSRRCTGSATATGLGAAAMGGATRSTRRSRHPRLLGRGRRLRPLGRQAAADRVRVGGRRAAARRGRPRLGMDLVRLPRLPRLRGVPLPGVLGGLLRRRATGSCAAAPGRPTAT